MRSAGPTIQLTVWPEDFIISPDPAHAGGGGRPTPPPTLADVLIIAGGRQALSGDLEPGDARRVRLTTALQLGNQGDSIRLSNPRGQVVGQVAYRGDQVRRGHTICFNR